MKEELIMFGLTPNEAEVYLALLTLGDATADRIASNTKIHRTTVYDVLNILKSKGFVSVFVKDKKQHFEAAEPEKFLDFLNEKKHIIQEILPKMESIKRNTVSKPQVTLFQGIDGIKTVLNEVLKCKSKSVLISANTTTLYKFIPIYFPQFIKRRIEEGVFAKILTQKIPETIKHKKEGKKALRELRFFNKDDTIGSSIFVFDDKTAFLSLSENEQIAILIKDKEITKSVKNMFEIAWKTKK